MGTPPNSAVDVMKNYGLNESSDEDLENEEEFEDVDMATNPFITDLSEVGKVVKGPGFGQNGLSSLASANEAMNQIIGTAGRLANQA
jgi:hypothetical protein